MGTGTSCPPPQALLPPRPRLSGQRGSFPETGPPWQRRQSGVRASSELETKPSPPHGAGPGLPVSAGKASGGSRRLAMCSWFVVFVTSFPEKQKRMQISHLQYLEYNISPRAFINMAPGMAPAPASSVGKPNSCYAYFSARPLRRWLLSRGDSVWD